MNFLEKRILKDGVVKPGNVLKVDSFLNHQMDIQLMEEIGREFHRRFAHKDINKIVTIEASGIGIACITAENFGVPVLFAKKSRSATQGPDYLSSKVVSFTHGQSYDVVVPKKYITEGDRILIIDDFLANGSALKALIKLAEKAGATVVGAGVAIEKVYQNGGNEIRQHGYRIEALAKIGSMSFEHGIEFC